MKRERWDSGKTEGGKDVTQHRTVVSVEQCPLQETRAKIFRREVS